MRQGRRWVGRAAAGAAAGAAAVAMVTTAATGTAGAGSLREASTPPIGAVEPYGCGPSGNAIAGTYGDAAVIGWAGDKDGVVACLGGSFYVRDGKDVTLGYGVYDATRTTWRRADGHLPALVTSFHRDGAAISITNFGDRVVVGGRAYVAVYSRVAVHNPTGHPVTVDPQPTPGLVRLATAPTTVAPGATVNHDYVVAADRFGATYAWPSAGALAAAGSWDSHFAHMQAYWQAQLAGIAQPVTLPDPSLVQAYDAGFIDTQIIREATSSPPERTATTRSTATT